MSQSNQKRPRECKAPAVVVVNLTIWSSLKKRCIGHYLKRQIDWPRVEMPCLGIPILIKKHQRGYKIFYDWLKMRDYFNGTV